MLYIDIDEQEIIDESTFEIYQVRAQTLKLEHSLISISKWESKWKKPFLHTDKTFEQSIDYIRCMTVGINIDPIVYYAIKPEDVKRVNDYIKDPMSATTFKKETGGRNNGEFVTSEKIYYYMVAFNIPSEYEKWHLNRLMNLIKICEIESKPKKKMKTNDILRQNAEINRTRRARLGTKG